MVSLEDLRSLHFLRSHSNWLSRSQRRHVKSPSLPLRANGILTPPPASLYLMTIQILLSEIRSERPHPTSIAFHYISPYPSRKVAKNAHVPHCSKSNHKIERIHWNYIEGISQPR